MKQFESTLRDTIQQISTNKVLKYPALFIAGAMIYTSGKKLGSFLSLVFN